MLNAILAIFFILPQKKSPESSGDFFDIYEKLNNSQ